MVRLLLLTLTSPFRFLRWLARKAWLVLRGYDTLDLHIFGALPDLPPETLLGGLLSDKPRAPGLLELHQVLERAARDSRLERVCVTLGPLDSGLGRVDELRVALRRVRDAGKIVRVYIESASLTEYWLALGASEIVLAPSGSLELTGIASEIVLLRGLLDKVGVRAELAARGKYKSMREMFTEHEISPANREMTQALVDDLYEQLLAVIIDSRALDRSQVEAALDAGPLRAEQATTTGLVDRTAYGRALDEQDEQDGKRRRALTARAYRALTSHLDPKGRRHPVALIEVTGHIKSGRSGIGPTGRRTTGSTTLVEQVDRACRDPHTQAILLRVDSPGGSALASDIMWEALCHARRKKPVVVSMANVAASGGYFVAGLPETPVVANPTAVTGSIGVVGGKLVARDLYERLGIKKAIIRRGRHASHTSDYEPYSNEELDRLARDMDAFYHDFVAKMAGGRGVPVDALDAVAQGRVWTGHQAKERGLVDHLGGFPVALGQLRLALGLAADATLTLSSPREPLGLLPRLLLGRRSSATALLDDVLGCSTALLDERVLALLPFEIRFR